MNVVRHPPPGKYRLTVEDFLRLDHADAFGSSRTELLDGDVIIMNAEYRPHAWVAGELSYRLRRTLEEMGSDLSAISASVSVSAHDMPLPDIVLTREPKGDGPVPLASVALIVEVSSTTLDRDRRDKMAIYARAGIPEYWIADLTGCIIHQMWSPVEEAYRQRRDVPFGEVIDSMTIAKLTVGTGGL